MRQRDAVQQLMRCRQDTKRSSSNFGIETFRFISRGASILSRPLYTINRLVTIPCRFLR